MSDEKADVSAPEAKVAEEGGEEAAPLEQEVKE